jgi:hypothetical protein
MYTSPDQNYTHNLLTKGILKCRLRKKDNGAQNLL